MPRGLYFEPQSERLTFGPHSPGRSGKGRRKKANESIPYGGKDISILLTRKSEKFDGESSDHVIMYFVRRLNVKAQPRDGAKNAFTFNRVLKNCT